MISGSRILQVSMTQKLKHAAWGFTVEVRSTKRGGNTSSPEIWPIECATKRSVNLVNP